MIDKIAGKAVLIALILQIGFIVYMNLFRADSIIDYDSSSAYMHEMEMGSQGRLFPLEYSYQQSLDLDSGAIISAVLYRISGNIFLSRGITNILVVFLYICIASYILRSMGLAPERRRFGVLLFLIPYSMIMLGYWRMLFAGGGFFAMRAMVPLLIISIINDIEKKKAFRSFLIRAILLMVMVFMTGLSSGAYVLLCAVVPLVLWELISAFIRADYSRLKSKRMLVAAVAITSSAAGIVLQKSLGFSTVADQKHILTSGKWAGALLDCFAGIFELFGGLTIHEKVSVFSAEAAGTAVNFIVTLLIISSIIYTIVKCIRKKEISDMNGYIFSLMQVNAFMFAFVDLKYGENVFESRYHLLPMLPAFFMLANMMEDISKSTKLKKTQINTLQILAAILFAASMIYGDAQWVYAKTALGSEKLSQLNKIMEDEGVDTAIVVGDDNKALGRKLRVYGRDVHYLVLSDKAESAAQTYFGGTRRYLDNSMQTGKTALISTEEAFKSLPYHLIADMRFLKEYDGLQIYVSDESRFDCVGGIIEGKDMVVDLPYSPGYSYENAVIDDRGCLLMKEGGGILSASYPSAEGSWVYTVYYDMSEPDDEDAAVSDKDSDMGSDISEKHGTVTITAGADTVSLDMDPEENCASSTAIDMKAGEEVSFLLSAPEGMRIGRIEISRKD